MMILNRKTLKNENSKQENLKNRRMIMGYLKHDSSAKENLNKDNSGKDKSENR